MRILIICPCWPGIEDAYNKGIEPNGMPGFYSVVRELIGQNHDIDVLVYTHKDVCFAENRMRTDHWFSKVRIVGVFKLKQHNKAARIIYEMMLPIKFNRCVQKILLTGKYDFVYGQGSFADCCRRSANKCGIPFGLRKFGDDFSPLVKECGIVVASIRSPLAALSYMTKKAFLLATNDGTELDKLALRFRKKPPYDIYVWNNGFEPAGSDEEVPADYGDKPFLFHCSRITREKGMDDVVDIFASARNAGFQGELLFAGTADDPVFFSEVKERIESCGHGSHIHYLGKVTAGQVRYLNRHAVGSIIAGKNNNLNNVLIETLGYGGIAIVRSTNLIDTVIQNGVNGFMFRTNDECRDIIMALSEGKYDIDSIRREAVTSCKSKFGTWEERARREVDLLVRYSGPRQE